MITLSPIVAALLAADLKEMFYLVKLTKKTGEVIFISTTFQRNITMDNGVTYPGNSKLISVDPPRIASNVDRELYSIVIADPDYSLKALVGEGLVGHILEVRVGLVDVSTNTPHTAMADTVISYRGQVDSVTFKWVTDEIGEATIQIMGISPVNSLDMKRSIFLSKDFIRNKNINDSCCDQMSKGSSQQFIRWGAKRVVTDNPYYI